MHEDGNSVTGMTALELLDGRIGHRSAGVRIFKPAGSFRMMAIHRKMTTWEHRCLDFR